MNKNTIIEKETTNLQKNENEKKKNARIKKIMKAFIKISVFNEKNNRRTKNK